jgi:predicted KAP-like P-loop ATPase
MLLEKLKIFPDKPLDANEQDKFDRSRFVKTLAQAIRQSSSKKGSTVLALMGPWGCGKTSLKNLAIKALDRPIDPRVMEFCPWQLSGTGKITTLFFEALIQQISGENEVPDADAKRKNFRLYADLLSKGSRVLDVIGGALLSSMTHSGDANVAGAAAVTKALGAPVKIASDILADFGKELPTDVIQLKKEISVALAELTRPILVVIDDIDRLPSEEIFEVIQIVNVNADFPNLVYLLLFDRRAVERSIERSFEHRGRDFLEKIIQGSFHVPALSVDEINKEFGEQLDTFLEGTQLKDALDHQRLSVLFFDVLWRYLGNPRHIKRLFSSLSFYIGQFSSEGALEVDLVDLIGIETLRLFETEIYEALPRYRDFLTATGETRLGLKREDIDRVQAEKRKEILELTVDRYRDKGACLVEFLFPPLAGQYRHQGEALVKLRICRAENFYRYFTFRPGLTEVSESELQSLLATAGSSQEAEETLRAFLDRGSLTDLITRLEHSIEQLSADKDKAMGLARALINIGDDIPRRLDLIFDDAQRSRWLFEKIVIGTARSGQGRSLAGLVSELLSTSSGVIIPASFCNALSESLSRTDSSIAQLIESNQVQQLSKAVVEKIGRLAHEGKLKNHLYSASLVYFWRRWGDSAEMKAWINSVINDRSGLFWFLRSVSQTADFEDPALPDNPYRFKIDLVEQFVDLDNLRNSIQTINLASLQAQERNLEQAFSLALKKWDTGQKDNDSTEVTA